MANALATLREAVTSLTEALQRAETRADAERARADVAMTCTDELREQITIIEAKLAEVEKVKEAARKRAHELSNRMMVLEAGAERAQEATERASGLDRLLADAERRLSDAEQSRATAVGRLDAMDRADAARRGRGRWARLRAAWRGE